MTEGATMQCQRCGFTNARGDQFCGSCGAFLEWQEPAPDATAATGPQPPPVPAGDAAPPSAAVTAVPDATPAVAATAPAGQATGDAVIASSPWTSAAAAPTEEPDGQPGLVRCPACGIANPASRTFCQSCGTALAAAQRVAEPSREAIEAAVSATRPPTVAVPAAVTRPAGRDRAGGRGIPGWIFVVGLAGILVGVVVVLLGGVLSGPGPGSGATSAPSLATAGPSAASAAPGDAGGGATPAAGAVRLTLTGATASSVVGDRAKFQPKMAIDGDLATSWQEGAADEKGQWIEVTFDPSRADTLVVRNGYQASTALYKGNLRLKDIEVSVDGGPPIAFRLKDVTKAQRIDLGGVSGATSVRITIQSTYPSIKTAIAGTPFDDAAVSEISVLGIPGG